MSNLDVIFGKASGTAIDPVCKMTVQKAAPGGGTAEHEGETYYFCGPGCNTAFTADPHKYLHSDGADDSHMGHEHMGHEHESHDSHMEHASAAVDTAICYPCNHSVDKATAPSWQYKDTTFYFCSSGCEEKVKAEPERWLVIANSKVVLEHKDHDHGHDQHAH
ncbi:MAG: YHS domain-containing protein [Chloroflexi bacterium]|nr:YHS domain-containing protein [Chloroflexota bacterium]